jgi:hypothetical protein
MEITTICPKCQTKITGPYVGSYKALLDKILQRAGHQPGDLLYAEIIKKIGLPEE